ncbi:MAG: TIGR04211 family SH3 domain-containing protein [Deltaproteobacteria bacterium]|nr:TIGR04211 family SH3 domain-containing protein [Deltaproteobacteria bacterium]
MEQASVTARRVALAALWVLALSALCHAQSAYISGYREVMLRSGPSVEHRILAVLRTGNEMDILGEDGDYNLVSLPDGREGYVLKSFLTNEAPPERRLEELTAVVDTQATELQRLRNENRDLVARNDKLTEDHEGERRQLQRLQQESANLERDERLWWFGSGAGVLLVGWLMGMTRVRLRRKARARSFT